MNMKRVERRRRWTRIWLGWMIKQFQAIIRINGHSQGNTESTHLSYNSANTQSYWVCCELYQLFDLLKKKKLNENNNFHLASVPTELLTIEMYTRELGVFTIYNVHINNTHVFCLIYLLFTESAVR